jgi:hypothetical protein
MRSQAFERFGALMSILTGAAAFGYAVAFIVVRTNDALTGLFLALVGLLSTAALVALYGRLREGDGAFALWALLLGMAGALATAAHGAYDLAIALHPPAAPNLDLPSPVDPRGFMTFGVAGLALFTLSWLIRRGDARLPRGLGLLGYLSAILLVVLYLGRLILLDATSPVILVPALVNGFVVGPAWWVWLGLGLRRAAEVAPTRVSAAASA